MQLFVVAFEILGTISFALSGAMTGIQKDMDIFGICVLGLTTATGGGIIRDLILGITPPATFVDPKYALIALAVSVVVFFPFVRRLFFANRRVYEKTLLVADAAGLGIFTVYGAKVALDWGYSENAFLVVFVAVITGVGGGVLRDVLAGNRPYIFIKHIYACAALLGALTFWLLGAVASENLRMLAGFSVILAVRLCSAKYHWSLPKAKSIE